MAKASTTEVDPRDERIERLEAQITALMKLVAETQPTRDRLKAATEKKRRDLDMWVARGEAGLFDGPRKFRVRLPREPMMWRIVGAADELRAQEKYQRYFGIRRIHEDAGEIIVEELTDHAAAEAEFRGDAAKRMVRLDMLEHVTA